MSSDTIFALSSGSLPSGVAVIRLSGPHCAMVMDVMLGDALEPRQASLRHIVNPTTNEQLDQGLAVYFAAPRSFTGEDVLEVQCHGGVATVEAILDALSGLEGLRTAEAGEFSRRAFENGRLDLTELEGLADLVAAQTEFQRKQALQQSSGSLRTLYDGWRDSLLQSRALVEAELDFSDEEDVPGSVSEAVWGRVEKLKKEVETHLQDRHRGEIVRDGFRIALLGPVNAGKSSLLNALARRDVAIVTPQAGTTRDVIEINLNIAGQLVIVSDTAGMRESTDLIEQEGIKRAIATARDADLVLWLQPFDNPQEPPGDLDAVQVRTKSDLGEMQAGKEALTINTITPDGVDPLLDWLNSEVTRFSRGSDEPVLTRRRHREALETVLVELDGALKPAALEVRSEYLRLAADSLGRLTGRIDVEDLLDVIFSEFCIGK